MDKKIENQIKLCEKIKNLINVYLKKNHQERFYFKMDHKAFPDETLKEIVNLEIVKLEDYNNIQDRKMTGIELIALERKEQLEKHNRTIENDAKFNNEQQLSIAATFLIHPDMEADDRIEILPKGWDVSLWIQMCNKSYKDRLIIAGALITAEIDRLNYEQ